MGDLLQKLHLDAPNVTGTLPRTRSEKRAVQDGAKVSWLAAIHRRNKLAVHGKPYKEVEERGSRTHAANFLVELRRRYSGPKTNELKRDYREECNGTWKSILRLNLVLDAHTKYRSQYCRGTGAVKVWNYR
jgi:hypothetical protein